MVAVTEQVASLPRRSPAPPRPGAGAEHRRCRPPSRPLPCRWQQDEPSFEHHFDFAPKACFADLLPAPARSRPAAIPFNEDLTKVAEVTFGESLSKELPKQDAMEAAPSPRSTHLNSKRTDGFVLALLDNRTDVAACRSSWGTNARLWPGPHLRSGCGSRSAKPACREERRRPCRQAFNGLAVVGVENEKQLAGTNANQEMIRHRP